MKILGYVSIFVLLGALCYWGGKEQVRLIASHPNFVIVPSPVGSVFMPIK